MLVSSHGKKRKLVRIDDKPRQVVEPQYFPTDSHQPRTCWYTKDDLHLSKKLGKELSRALDTDTLLVDTYNRAVRQDKPQAETETILKLQCSGDYWKQRGLERWSSQHAIARSIQVCQLKLAVMLEQTSQCIDGTHDPSRLAEICQTFSRPSQQFAQVLAQADEQMAKIIHAEPSGRNPLILRSA